ncbi:hypothetical protein AaE_003202 [Aphanomyces astaci]|uniref:Uncharacterized protein n=1 Tax=Aphanomyces astaci TaxID=112090 RepID=A0A6A5ARA5_APHAT|nr:hypothetical protein AaE_003202 [Aphanomyces astaci]
MVRHDVHDQLHQVLVATVHVKVWSALPRPAQKKSNVFVVQAAHALEIRVEPVLFPLVQRPEQDECKLHLVLDLGKVVIACINLRKYVSYSELGACSFLQRMLQQQLGRDVSVFVTCLPNVCHGDI